MLLRTFLPLSLGFLLLVPASADEKKVRDDAAKKLTDDFKKALEGAKTPQEKAVLIHAFGDSPVKAGTMAAALARFLAPSPADINYLLVTTATEALAKFRGERVAAQILMGSMENFRRIPYVYKKMVLALGRVGHESAMPLLEEWITGSDGDQAALAVEAMAEMPAAPALELLLRLWDQMNKKRDRANDDQKKVIDRVSAEALKAIKKLSGEKYTTMPEYVIWWSRRAATIKEEDKKKEAARRAAAPAPSKMPPILIVELLFNNNAGTATPNTGSSSGHFPTAAMSAPKPSWVTTFPPNGGPSALDFGNAPTGPFAVDMGGMVEHLRNLKSFTLTFWVSVKSGVEGPGGNRILSWLNHGRDGVELVTRADGSLQLGVNQWAEASAAKTAPGVLPVYQEVAGASKEASDAALAANWRFIAVTYDSTASAGQVKFYSGTRQADAKLAVAVDYARGPVGPRIGPNLTVGNVTAISRPQGMERAFRGVIDEVRIYGSPVDGFGALAPADVVKAQDRVQRAAE